MDYNITHNFVYLPEISITTDVDVIFDRFVDGKYNNQPIMWETTTNDVIFTFIVGFVEFYEDDKIITLEHISSRALCLPFLSMPYLPSQLIIENMLKTYPNAIPIMYSVGTSLEHGLYMLKNIYGNTNILKTTKYNLVYFKNEDYSLYEYKQNNVKPKISEEDILKMYGDEVDDKPKQKSKKKKSKKRKYKKPVIDITEAKDNEIIEIDYEPEPVLSVEDDTDSDNDTSNANSNDNSNDNTNDNSTEDDDDTYIENIVNDNNTIVKYIKLPVNIIFYKYEFIPWEQKDLITFMITETYNNNITFKQFLHDYDTIRIIQGLHRDFNQKNNSVHFNAIFYNTELKTKTSQYHFYVKQNVITGITTVINLI
jgi:hypothetical protein